MEGDKNSLQEEIQKRDEEVRKLKDKINFSLLTGILGGYDIQVTDDSLTSL